MSTRGETITFCVTSLGRNCFLQVPTGLFGGDLTGGIGSYDPASETYRNSATYRSTVTVMDGVYQRAPASCWYCMGAGLVRAIAGTGDYTLALAWTITDGLWNSVRVPGQCLTFVDDGRLVHGLLTTDTTQTLAVVHWSAGDAGSTLEVGDIVPYMIRQRPPRATILGPVEITADGQAVRVQGRIQDPTFVTPEVGAHLLYVGRRSAFPSQPCLLDTDAGRARDWIFAVEAVDVQPASVAAYALQSSSVTTALRAWRQLTPWMAVGSLALAADAIPTGAQYDWPYPPDQSGSVFVVVPLDPGHSATTAVLPDNVFLVRDAILEAELGGIASLGYTDGDFLVVLDTATRLPKAHVRYDAATRGTVAQPALPTGLLLAVENGRRYPNAAWWMPDAATRFPYTVCVAQPHARGSVHTAVRSAPTSLATAAVRHAFVLLSRRSDGLYAALPAAVVSNLTNTAPAGWAWTYPLATEDGTDCFRAELFTDGLLGVPLRQNPASGVDYAGVRRRVGPRLIDDPRPPEYLRVNVDMGGPVVLRAFAWALVADSTFPTLTVHGSNDPAFYNDPVVVVTARTPAGAFSRNTHQLATTNELLWQLTFDRVGSDWSAADVASGLADIFLTRLAADPRYTRLATNGTPANGEAAYAGFDAAGSGTVAAHVFPAQAHIFPAYRYYALCVSVGLLTGSVPHSLPGWLSAADRCPAAEVQEFQPLVEAPNPATSPSATLYGRLAMPVGAGLYTLRLSRPVPTAERGISDNLGYIEVWDSFVTRTAYHQGQAWSASTFPAPPGLAPGPRRAVAILSELVLPRYAIIRSQRMSVLNVSYLWCFVRHRALTPVGDQSVIVPRLSDPGRNLETHLQPPSWTGSRDVLWFLLTLPGARIPCGSLYLSISGSNTVQVWVNDTTGSALPEFCIVLPSGEIVDFQQYDDNIPLPAEVPQDGSAGVSAMFTIHFDEPPPKRRRAG